MDNATVARKLFDLASALEATGHSLYRIRSYRRAAGVVKMLPCSVSDLVKEGGRAALLNLPGIGAHLAYTLEKLVSAGELRILGPSPEQTDPRERLLSLPGVGDRTAERMRDAGIDTADEAEQANDDGRLDLLDVAPRRLRGIRSALVSRKRQKQERALVPREPSVADLLEVDAQFRELRAAQGGMRDCAVGGPVLRSRRGAWSLRAMFSQSPLAYRLGQARDWVVVQFDNGQVSGERIIITETRQHLRGRRVVRGREGECQACWAS